MLKRAKRNSWRQRWFGVREPVVPNSVIEPGCVYGSWSRGYYPPVYPAQYKKPVSGGSDNRLTGNTLENAIPSSLYHR